MKPQKAQYAGAQPTAQSGLPAPLWFGGFVLLDLAVLLTALLTAESLVGLGLPGCGINSACAAAAASVFGKVPLINLPVSYVGLAYFVSMLLGWILVGQHGLTSGYRNAARLGMAASVFFVAMLIKEGHLCWYCVLSHGANFGFWLIVEIAAARQISVRAVMAKVAVVFLVVAAGLQAAHVVAKGREEQKQEAKLTESTAAIAEASRQKAADPTAPPAGVSDTNKADSGRTPPGQPAPATETSQAAGSDRPWQGGFTGRWRQGPEKAAIRIVMIMDYQCIDCQRIETMQVKQILEKQPDVSLSVKHFPMCAECNPGFATRNLHPNACWAARAAEAAGILYGNDGFWKMHDWLFERKGGFTDHDLNEGLTKLGFDRPRFIATMKSEETLRRVQSDIAEAMWLGLYYTPMIFINGVELKGVFAPNAVTRAVENLTQQNLPPMACDQDQPPPAMEKIVTDWRNQAPRMIPPDSQTWPMGDDTAPLRVILWGDYQEPYSAKADAMIRKMLASTPDARYEFRQYPVNQLCNPVCINTKHPQACRAAAAAEAAGLIGGKDAYWKMHQWLMANQPTFNDETLRDAATQMGLNADELFARMDAADVKTGISEDARTAKSLGLTSIPFIFVNERHVERWMLGETPTLDAIIDEARKMP